MEMKINYLGICVIIDVNAETITIVSNNTNSKVLFNMVFKAILNKVNIDTNGYTVVRKC